MGPVIPPWVNEVTLLNGKKWFLTSEITPGVIRSNCCFAWQTKHLETGNRKCRSASVYLFKIRPNFLLRTSLLVKAQLPLALRHFSQLNLSSWNWSSALILTACFLGLGGLDVQNTTLRTHPEPEGDSLFSWKRWLFKKSRNNDSQISLIFFLTTTLLS